MKTQFYVKLLLTSIFCTVAASSSFATVYFVTPGGTGTGTGWSAASSCNIEYLASHMANGDAAYLQAGNYTPSASIVNGVAGSFYIKGGYPASATGTDTSGYNAAANPTNITDAQSFIVTPSTGGTPNKIYLIGLAFPSNNGNHIPVDFSASASSGNTLVVDQCSFSNQTLAKEASCIDATDNSATGPTVIHITNSYFSSNNSSSGGNITINHETSNTSDNGNLLIDKCTFNNSISTQASMAQGVSLLTVNYMTISNSYFCNTTRHGGSYGAMLVSGCTGVTISGNTFNSNQGGTTAGGISFNGSSSATRITGNIFYQNADGSGNTSAIGADLSAVAGTTLTNNQLQLAYNPTDYPNTTDGGGNTVVAANPGNCPAAIVLPVTIISFTGIKGTNGNLLSWTAADAVNFSRFELQRSNGNGFAAIASLPLNTGGSYSYTDAAPPAGTDYYRLALIDLDGSVLYSGTVAIVGSGDRFTVAGIYPVPASTVLNVAAYSPSRADVRYTITDMGGRVLSVQTHTANSGASTQAIDVSGLARGNYLMVVDAASGTKNTLRFTKL